MVKPVYPAFVRDKGIHGTVVVCFTVEPDGSVSDPFVKSASSGKVKKYLAKPALDAISQWRFSPRLVAGEPVASRACQPLVFRMNQPLTPKIRIIPPYPMAAGGERVEGVLVVCFTVEPDGSVSDPYIKSASSEVVKRYFDRTLIRTILHWKFYPKVVDGKAVAAQACQPVSFSRSQTGDS